MTATAATLGIDSLRRRYVRAVQGLAYDSCDLAAASAAVRAACEDSSPSGWVEAAECAVVRCGRCAGTGRYITHTENGKARGSGGVCFRCNGQGQQTAQDGHRNAAADRELIRREAAAMMGR